MTVGFTESKADSNLYFKVECRRPEMLLLYVEDLFLTKKRNSLKLQECMEVCQNIPGRREVCSRDPEEVQDDGMQGHEHTYGIELEAIE